MLLGEPLGRYATEGSNPRHAGFARDHRGPTRHSAPGRSCSATHTFEPRFGQAARLRSQDFELAAISVKAGPPPSREEFERERNEARQRKMASDLEATLLTKLLVSCRPTPSRLPGHTSPRSTDARCPMPDAQRPSPVPSAQCPVPSAQRPVPYPPSYL